MKHITEGNNPYKTGALYDPANFVAGKKISEADNAIINGKINVAKYETFLAPFAVKPFSAKVSLIFGSIVLVTPRQVPTKLVLIAQKLNLRQSIRRLILTVSPTGLQSLTRD